MNTTDKIMYNLEWLVDKIGDIYHTAADWNYKAIVSVGMAIVLSFGVCFCLCALAFVVHMLKLIIL